MKLTQLKGMIYYELMLLWRQRVLLIMMVSTLIIMLGMTESLRQQSQAVAVEGADSGQIVPAELIPLMEYWHTSLLIGFSTTPVLMMMLVVAIPIIMAERIPYDRQYGVGELLNSLPLGQGTYLTGKLLGTWTGLLLGLTGLMLTGGLLNRLLFGPYFAGGYLLSFISLLPLALFTAGVSVMLAAGQPNRQRAILVGLLVMTSLIVNILYLQNNFTVGSNSWQQLITPFQMIYVELQFAYWEQNIPDALKVFIEDISEKNAFDFTSVRLSSLYARLQIITALAVLQVVLGWLITWGWMRWREGR